MRVLLVEDDSSTVKSVELVLKSESNLTALLFLAGCSEFEFQLTASPEPGVAEPTRIPDKAQSGFSRQVEPRCHRTQ